MYSNAGDAGKVKIQQAYYEKAEKLLWSLSWEEASAAFAAAGEYQDAAQRVSEPFMKAGDLFLTSKAWDNALSMYAKAEDTGAQAVQKNPLSACSTFSMRMWSQASAEFAAAGAYKDAVSRVAEPFVRAGDIALTGGNYTQAVSMYAEAGTSGDAKRKGAYYAYAEALMTEASWDEAAQAFKMAEDYLDAKDRQTEPYEKAAVKAVESGDYALASAYYKKAGNEEASQKSMYTLAEHLLAEKNKGNWEESSREFQLAENYLDAQSRVYEPYYVHGKQLLEQKAYLSAAEAFVKAEDFPNAEMHAKEAWYNYAQDLLDEQEYGKAETYFSKASGYMNADEMSHESIYLLGSAYLEQSDFEKAYDAFRTIRGYRDVDDMLQTWRLRQVAQGRTGKRSKYTVGRCIGLGKYMQSAGCDQSETVEWMIICRDDNRVLLTTRYILTASAFSANQSGDYMSSKVRSYLNGPFLQECFDGKLLQSLIPQENLEGDKVFLLSRDECDDYLLNGKWQYKNRAAAKSWARAQGVAVTGSHHVGNYWLRDLSSSESGALAVRQDGSYSVIAANDATVGIRPAVWIDLDVLYPQ